jgi:hypothetical protein
MKITDIAAETIDSNLMTCAQILSLMFTASQQHKGLIEPMQSWHDEILKLECLIDDMRGLLKTDLTD